MVLSDVSIYRIRMSLVILYNASKYRDVIIVYIYSYNFIPTHIETVTGMQRKDT